MPDPSSDEHGAPTFGTFDYIIIGAGTAGCVLANRLSADPANRVLLIEAGGHDRYHWVTIPIGYLFCMGNPRTDWLMNTAAEAQLNGRSLPYPRGRILGGCSSINGMIYMRGQAADYDRWRQSGNVGWGWDDVLPYFLRSEDNFRGATPMHGAGGEWKVARQRLTWPILEDFRDAAAEFGIPKVEDFNTGTNEGSGFFEVNQRNGFRWNASQAFLKPARNRANLEVVTEAHTERIVLGEGAARGVTFTRHGVTRTARANVAVVLSAGAINSPHLLELSGIGDAEALGRAGIAVRHPLPGVGNNLQDHLQIRTVFRVENADTLNQRANSLAGKVAMALDYAVRRRGPLSMAPSQLGIFAKSDPRLETPDLEYHVQPLSTDRLGEPLHRDPAITVSVCNLRPDSRGAVHAVDADPYRHPLISPNYLAAGSDRRVALASVRHARSIMTAETLRKYRPREVLPGAGVEDDDDLLRAIGDIATTIFHPVGTCKMGSSSDAVVDDRLRVHGIDRLRVVDASIMPTIVSGNTASPVVMIAEKAAEMILRDSRETRH